MLVAGGKFVSAGRVDLNRFTLLLCLLERINRTIEIGGLETELLLFKLDAGFVDAADFEAERTEAGI